MLCPSLQPKQQLSKTPPTLYIWLGVGRQGRSPKNWRKKINSVSNKGGGDLVCHLAPFDQCYCYNKNTIQSPFQVYEDLLRPSTQPCARTNLSFSMIFSSHSFSIRPFACKKIVFLLQFFFSFTSLILFFKEISFSKYFFFFPQSTISFPECNFRACQMLADFFCQYFCSKTFGGFGGYPASSFYEQNSPNRTHTIICNIVEHAKLQLFFSSEVKPKWLVRTKLTHPPCSPSAWTSARRWQDRGTPSTSPSPLVPPSPSPWTPGARK